MSSKSCNWACTSVTGRMSEQTPCQMVGKPFPTKRGMKRCMMDAKSPMEVPAFGATSPCAGSAKNGGGVAGSVTKESLSEQCSNSTV